MTDKILVVTSPDDIHLKSTRILLVELDPDQSQAVSDALLKLENLKDPLVSYVWKMGDSVTWLIDKLFKSDLVIFNASPKANSSMDLIIGYVAACPGSYYFGTLRDLQEANNRVIYNDNDVLKLLEDVISNHDRKR